MLLMAYSGVDSNKVTQQCAVVNKVMASSLHLDLNATQSCSLEKLNIYVTVYSFSGGE